MDQEVLKWARIVQHCIRMKGLEYRNVSGTFMLVITFKLLHSVDKSMKIL